ncbi:MAG: LysE family translocator [Desulfovibrionales bacterium]|nr:LysE family translocator [Desulfovibrionales bacterium]
MLPENFGEFLFAITILSIIPGADTMMVIRNSLRGGFKDGTITSAGISSGLFVHAAISGCGLALIIYNSAQAYHILKVVGAFYIVYLGLQNLREAKKRYTANHAEQLSVTYEPVLIHRSFREGVLSNVLNPKTAVFYMTFLPQYMNPESNLLLQSFTLAGMHFGISFVWQCILAGIVDKIKRIITAPKSRSYIEATAGSILVGLGIKLAVSE